MLPLNAVSAEDILDAVFLGYDAVRRLQAAGLFNNLVRFEVLGACLISELKHCGRRRSHKNISLSHLYSKICLKKKYASAEAIKI